MLNARALGNDRKSTPINATFIGSGQRDQKARYLAGVRFGGETAVIIRPRTLTFAVNFLGKRDTVELNCRYHEQLAGSAISITWVSLRHSRSA